MPPSISPYSGPNDINYTCRFPAINNKPYFSLRPMNTDKQWYNIGFAPVDANGMATSFTFNVSNFIRSEESANPNPFTLPIPPAPGLYKLVLNKDGATSSNPPRPLDIIFGVINLQNNNIVPKTGDFKGRFTCGFKNTDDPIAQAPSYYMKYNDEPTKLTLSLEFRNLNRFSFIGSGNPSIDKVGTYKVYTLGDQFIDSFVIDANPNLVNINEILINGNDAGQQFITNLSNIETTNITSPLNTGFVQLKNSTIQKSTKLGWDNNNVYIDAQANPAKPTVNSTSIRSSLLEDTTTAMQGRLTFVAKEVVVDAGEFKHINASKTRHTSFNYGSNIYTNDYADPTAPNTITASYGTVPLTSGSTNDSAGQFYVYAGEFYVPGTIVSDTRVITPGITSPLNTGFVQLKNSTIQKSTKLGWDNNNVYIDAQANPAKPNVNSTSIRSSLLEDTTTDMQGRLTFVAKEVVVDTDLKVNGGITTSGGNYTPVISWESGTGGANNGNIGKIYKANFPQERALTNINESLIGLFNVPKGVYIIDIYLLFKNADDGVTLGFGSNAHLTLSADSNVQYDYDMSNNNNISIGPNSYDYWNFNPVLSLPYDATLYLNLSVDAYVGSQPRLQINSYMSATRIS